MLHDESHFKPALYPDSSETSSSSPPLTPIRPSKGGQQSFLSTATRKGSSVYRTERAKELKRLPTDDLINLVLLGEYKIEKTEGRLKKYLLILQEQAEAERKAKEEAKHVREKMTQTILDTQQEALRARQDVEQYKLKLENAQREIRRGIEVVKVLEDDKEDMERALQRSRDKARQLKEKSAIQLAREQGRRIGYEEGLEKGRLVAQMQALAASRIQDSADSRRSKVVSGALRRALTQGPNDSSSHRRRSSHTRHNSLDQHTTRSSEVRETVSRPNVRRSSVDNATSAPQVQESLTTGTSASRPVAPTPSREQIPLEFLQRVYSDGSGGSAGPRDDTTSRPAITDAAEMPQPSQHPPPEVFRQARSDGSQSSGSGSSSVKSRRASIDSVRRASAPQQQGGTDRPADPLISIRPTRPLETTSERSVPQQRPRQVPSSAFQPTSTASQAPRRDPAPYPGVPPAKQFPAGLPRDDISNAPTSPSSSVGGIDIVTHPPASRPPSVVFAPQPPPPPPPAAPAHHHERVDDGGNRRTRERPPPRDDVLPVIPEDVRHTGGPGAVPSPGTQHRHGPMQPPPMPQLPPHIQVPQFYIFPPDQSASPIGGTSTPVHHQDQHHFLTPRSPVSPAYMGGGSGSNRSSLSFEFKVEPPSQPATPTLEATESGTGENALFLSPNSRPISLPSVQPQPQPQPQPRTPPPPTFTLPHHVAHEEPSRVGTPVVPLPIPPRVVSQPTLYGTPVMGPVDLGVSGGMSASGSISRPGTTPPAPVYVEAPTPAGFEYPAPLGGLSGSQGTSTGDTGPATTGKTKGKGKRRKSVTVQSPQEDIVRPASTSASSGFYGQPSSSPAGAAGAVIPPVVPGEREPILPVAPPTISPVLPPVIMPVLSSPAGGSGGAYRNPGRGGMYLEDEISDTSFDSATKRNTHMNAQMYGQGSW
ncbi:hypothetical protein AX14_006041 [Amanita brunnescens Koide BX004]|nr:hypothetical protein AX14_006041 [Amanita brunnescens Koide BX004]